MSVATGQDGDQTRTISLKADTVSRRPRFRAHLEGRARQDAECRPVPRSDDGNDYLLACVTPAARPRTRQTRLPREVDLRHRQFRLDGRPVDEQAKASLRYATRPAGPRPTSSTSSVSTTRWTDDFERCRRRPAPDNRQVGEELRRRPEADGGTEMMPALRAALRDAAPDRQARRCARWCSSPTAPSATNSRCSDITRQHARHARGSSWSASARRRTPIS